MTAYQVIAKPLTKAIIEPLSLQRTGEHGQRLLFRFNRDGLSQIPSGLFLRACITDITGDSFSPLRSKFVSRDVMSLCRQNQCDDMSQLELPFSYAIAFIDILTSTQKNKTAANVRKTDFTQPVAQRIVNINLADTWQVSGLEIEYLHNGNIQIRPHLSVRTNIPFARKAYRASMLSGLAFYDFGQVKKVAIPFENLVEPEKAGTASEHTVFGEKLTHILFTHVMVGQRAIAMCDLYSREPKDNQNPGKLQSLVTQLNA